MASLREVPADDLPDAGVPADDLPDFSPAPAAQAPAPPPPPPPSIVERLQARGLPIPPSMLVMSRPGTPFGALMEYGGRVADHFSAGADQTIRGADDVANRGMSGTLQQGNVFTGVPRMALGLMGAALSPVTAAVGPVVEPVIQPVANAFDRNISQPIEARTGYPHEVITQGALALAPLGVGKVRSSIAKAAGEGKAAEAIQDFSKIGETPTLAQATSGSNSPLQYLGRLLEFSPGGYLPYKGRIKSQLLAAETRINEALAKVGDVSQQDAGLSLQQGAQNFAGKISKTAGRLEAKLDAAVPGKTIIAPNNTLQALNDMSAVGDGSQVGASTVSSTIKAALEQFSNDVKANGGVSFEALKRFRTRLGAKTNSGQSLIADLSSGEASQLYKALTKDMEEAATAAGQGNLVKLRNSYYSQRKGELENIFEKRIKQDGAPEQVYRSFRDSDFSQAERIMRQLSPQQRRQVAGQVLREMGMPTSGEAAGETATFSLDRFDTMMSKLSGTPGKGGNRLDNFFSMSGTQDLRAALKEVAAVSERFKGAEKFLKNPSQSAVVGTQLGTLGAIGGVALYDPVQALFMAAAAYGVPYALVRGGNSAAFIRLIAGIGKQNKASLPGYLLRMSTFVSQNPQYAPAMKQIMDNAYRPKQLEAPPQRPQLQSPRAQ